MRSLVFLALPCLIFLSQAPALDSAAKAAAARPFVGGVFLLFGGLELVVSFHASDNCWANAASDWRWFVGVSSVLVGVEVDFDFDFDLFVRAEAACC